MLIFDYIRQFFYKKQQIKAIFIDEANKVIIKRFKYKKYRFVYKRMGQEPEMYIVNPKKARLDVRTGLPTLLYSLHNPEPMDWEYGKNPEVESNALNEIIESQVILDLFKDQKTPMQVIIMVLLIIIVVMVLFLILVQMGVVDITTTTKAAA